MIYLIIAISTIVFTIWTLFCGSIQIRCNDRDFNIEAKGWNDYTVEYSQIDSISYEENVLQKSFSQRAFSISCVQRSWTTLAGESPVTVIASEPCS